MLKKKIISLLIAVFIISSLSNAVFAAPVEYGEELKDVPATTPTVSFADLKPTHWAYKYVVSMVDRKVIDGYPDGLFRPDRTITRAELAKIIVNATGIQPKKVNYSSFTDVKITDWASPYVEAVKDYLTGFRTADGQYVFNPSLPALREDMSVSLVKVKGYDTRFADRSIIEAMFSDYQGISEEAKNYMAMPLAHYR